jgi:hypothetical protein
MIVRSLLSDLPTLRVWLISWLRPMSMRRNSTKNASGFSAFCLSSSSEDQGRGYRRSEPWHILFGGKPAGGRQSADSALELRCEAWFVVVSECCAIGINRRLPSRPEYHRVANAIHFSFLPPCSAAESQQFPRICTDPPGFDRAAFHKHFQSEVIAFLRKHLPGRENQGSFCNERFGSSMDQTANKQGTMHE